MMMMMNPSMPMEKFNRPVCSVNCYDNAPPTGEQHRVFDFVVFHPILCCFITIHFMPLCFVVFNSIMFCFVPLHFIALRFVWVPFLVL